MGTDSLPQPGPGPSRAPQSRDDIVSLLSDVEVQLQTLKDAHTLRKREIAHLQELGESLESRERDLNARASALKSQQADLAQAEQQLSKRMIELADSEREGSQASSRCAELEERLATLGSLLGAAEAQCERASQSESAQKAELQAQNEELESLRGRLDEAREIRDRDSSAANEQIELERTRLGAEIESCQTQLDKALTALETRTQELHAVAVEFRSVRSALDESKLAGLAARGDLDELQNKFQQQTDRAKQIEDQLAQALARERVAEARSIEFERRLDEVQSLEASDGQLTERINELIVQRDRLQSDCERMAGENQRLRAQAQDGSPDLAGLQDALEEAQIELLCAREQAEGNAITVMRSDDWNETRRRRLLLVRQLLTDRTKKVRKAGAVAIRRMDDAEVIIKQRGEVIKASHRLRAMDKRLNQRQAQAKSGLGVLAMVLSLAIVGTFGWIVAGSVAPARFAVTANIEPHVQGRALSDVQRQAWHDSIRELLLDPAVIESAASRMKERGIEDLSEAGALMVRLERDLAVIDQQDGNITLELRGSGARETERVLDTYGKSVISAANNRVDTRATGAAARLAGPIKVGDPIESERLYYAAVGVAIATVFCFLLMFLLWRKLAKVKSDFDQAAKLDLVLDDARWISPSPAD